MKDKLLEQLLKQFIKFIDLKTVITLTVLFTYTALVLSNKAPVEGYIQIVIAVVMSFFAKTSKEEPK